MDKRAANRGARYPEKIFSRVSAEDKEKIRESAEIAGMTVCKFIRVRATGGTIKSKVDIKTLHELNRLGRMLKKMWSEGHPTGPALNAVTDAAKKLEQAI